MILEKPIPVPKSGDPCLVCGGPRKMPASRMHREHAARDPFCSAECSRIWHGNPMPAKSIWGRD